MSFAHRPVLLEETVASLRIKPDGTYVDGTLGGGGHAGRICDCLGEGGRLIGIDRDGEAVEAASARLAPYGDRVRIVRGNFGEADRILGEMGIRAADGICLDLGVSSRQFDDAARGFSYREDAPLDMRMDRRQALTAADVVNGYTEEELVRILTDYGEERYAGAIARQIVKRRQRKRIGTTGELSDTVCAAVPAKMRAGGHPSRRTFQAVRIEVNRELEILDGSIGRLIGLLNPGGRLCVITFHSLEDRIVKERFRENEAPCVCPPDFPVCVCGRRSRGRVVTRKPIVPTPEEIEENRRCRSAKLRVFERAPD